MPAPLPHQRHPDSTWDNPMTWGEYWEINNIEPPQNYWVPTGAASGPRTPLYSNTAAGVANIGPELERKGAHFHFEWVNPETGETQWAPSGRTPPDPTATNPNLLLYGGLAIVAYLIFK